VHSTGSNLSEPALALPPKPEVGLPLWLLAELTYRCPLQCPYCSNPLDFAEQGKELSTEQWIKVFREAREMGAAQLGFSGGEPLVRQDLAELIGEARKLGFYTNLITSGIGLTEQKISDFKKAGLDHIQISFQASDEQVNNLLAGSKKAFAQKLAMARAVKAHGYPMVLNFVTHRHNIDKIDRIIELCIALEADFVELATCQFYGWAQLNRVGLLPTKEQLVRAERITNQYRAKLEAEGHPCKLIFVDSWPQHYPWIDPAGYEYFRTRLGQARRDVEHGLAITLQHYTTYQGQQRMLEILQFKLDILWSMLDAMTMAYELDRPPYHSVTDQRVWHKGIAL